MKISVTCSPLHSWLSIEGIYDPYHHWKVHWDMLLNRIRPHLLCASAIDTKSVRNKVQTVVYFLSETSFITNRLPVLLLVWLHQQSLWFSETSVASRKVGGVFLVVLRLWGHWCHSCAINDFMTTCSSGHKANSRMFVTLKAGLEPGLTF